MTSSSASSSVPRRVLAIDPGSRVTGYAVLDMFGTQVSYIDSGCIRVADEAMPIRLMTIYQSIEQLIVEFRPKEFAIEQIFMHANPNSALKLGQARGVALVPPALHGLPIGEYAPKAIKLAVVGTGNANKAQVQHMVKVLLNLQGKVQSDAADALAIGLCHIHHLQSARNRKHGGDESLWDNV